MGSVFKRTFKKSDGTVEKKGKWYISYYDSSGRRRREAAYTDKASSMQKLARKEKEAAQRQTGLADLFRTHSQTLLREHLKEFESYLKGRGVTERYQKTCISQLKLAFKQMEASYPDDLTADKGERFLIWLTEDKKFSLKTRNDYLSVLRKFARWGVKRERWPRDPFENLNMVRTEQDIRRKRRALTGDELQKLLEVAKIRVADIWREYPRASAKRLRELEMLGYERSLIYKFAAVTGLRKNEIKTLRWVNISLEADTPSVTVEARYSKSRRKGVVALPADLAVDLREWQRLKASDSEKVFQVPRHLTEHFKKDCEAAGIPLIDAAGRVVDFHSLRHTTATLLSKAKVSPRAAQAHLRHAQITTTMKTYTHIEMLDRQEVAEELSALIRGQSDNETNMRQKSLTEAPEAASSFNEPHSEPSKKKDVSPHKDNSLRIVFQQDAQAVTSNEIVGAPGFEPGTSCSQGRRANLTALRPA
jgi:integrase